MTWSVQVRKATKILEEQADGETTLFKWRKKELTRTFHLSNDLYNDTDNAHIDKWIQDGFQS